MTYRTIWNINKGQDKTNSTWLYYLLSVARLFLPQASLTWYSDHFWRTFTLCVIVQQQFLPHKRIVSSLWFCLNISIDALVTSATLSEEEKTIEMFGSQSQSNQNSGNVWMCGIWRWILLEEIMQQKCWNEFTKRLLLKNKCWQLHQKLS